MISYRPELTVKRMRESAWMAWHSTTSGRRAEGPGGAFDGINVTCRGKKDAGPRGTAMAGTTWEGLAVW